MLVVDDDDDLRAELAEVLELHGKFAVRQAADGASGLAMATAGRCDLILLDVGLPDLDGRLLCRTMRASGIRAPIVMLSGRTADDDAIRGLESGANDYVTKPFRLGVLLARIRAHLREFEKSDEAVLRFGTYGLHPASGTLVDEPTGHEIRLTKKEAAILRYLHRADGVPVSRAQLLHDVWGYQATASTHTVETHVYRLRRKLEPDPAAPRILVTVGKGYRLVG